MKQESKLSMITKGFLKENPVLRLVLGTCPTLAITTAVFNGLGMGVAATFVLICSNAVISMLRKAIPDQVRLPAFIVVIASFVTVTHMLVRAYQPALNEALGVYLPLITVNCIILGRAEMFASKNKVLPSILDGLGMGIGFTIVLILMSALREFMGFGTLLGIQILPDFIPPLTIMILPAGGFLVFAVFMALTYFIENKTDAKRSAQAACDTCGMCAIDSGNTAEGKV